MRTIHFRYAMSVQLVKSGLEGLGTLASVARANPAPSNVCMSLPSWNVKMYVVCIYAHGPFRLIASINYISISSYFSITDLR